MKHKEAIPQKPTTKDKIFDSALFLFSEKGYDGVSIRDIARAVGIKESSIYNHYQGKRTILDDICSQFIKTLSVSRPSLAEIEEMLKTSRPHEIFLYLIVSYGQRINPKLSLMAKIVFSEQFHDEEVHDIFEEEIIQKNVEYYESVLSLMERNNLIKPCDKNILANVFNNEQIMLTFQFSTSKSDEERKNLGRLMKKSAEFLFIPLEIN